MKPTDLSPNRYPWPPLILIAAMVVGSVVNALVPLRIPRGVAADILQGAGIVAAICALILYFLAVREMRRHATTIRPHEGASHLVVSGPFAFTRNPIYLANVLLLLAWGLIFANGWMLLVALAAGYAQQKLAIEREEAHLEYRFGKSWRDYRKRVRRWI